MTRDGLTVDDHQTMMSPLLNPLLEPFYCIKHILFTPFIFEIAFFRVLWLLSHHLLVVIALQPSPALASKATLRIPQMRVLLAPF